MNPKEYTKSITFQKYSEFLKFALLASYSEYESITDNVKVRKINMNHLQIDFLNVKDMSKMVYNLKLVFEPKATLRLELTKVRYVYKTVAFESEPIYNMLPFHIKQFHHCVSVLYSHLKNEYAGKPFYNFEK